jgi:hypothetical protein
MGNSLRRTLLTKDAVNRAARTLWQNIGIDILVAIVTVLYPVLIESENWAELDWKWLGFSVLKTVVLVVFSFVMRRFLDASPIPTPLPPAPVPEPNEDQV